MASSACVPLGSWYTVYVNTTPATIGASRFSVLIGDKSSARQTFRDAMIAAGFTGLKLHYIVICQVQDSGASGWPYSNQWAYKTTDWATINAQESWFLHSATPATSANRISSSSHWWYMDPGSTGWQAWCAARAQEMKDETTPGPYFGYDGPFFDNLELAWTKPYNASGSHLYDGAGNLIASSAAYATRVVNFVTAIRTQLGAGAKIWANIISGSNTGSEWNTVMGQLDGGMHEAAVGWDATYLSTSQQDGVLTQLEWCLTNSKGFIFAGQGGATDNAKELYALCTYLMVRPANSTPTSTPITSFRYTKTTEYAYWREFSNFVSGLGEPLGARWARTDGVVGWGRYFDNGTVLIDETTHTGTITLGIVNAPMVSTAVSTTLTNTLAISVPTGVVDGDMMILHVSSREDGQTITTPAGWTLIDSDTETTTTPDTIGAIFSRIAASEPASYTVTLGINAAIALSIVAVRGAVGVDVYGKNKFGSSATFSTTNGVTTTYADDIILQLTTIQGASTGVTADASTTDAADIEATVNTTNDVSAHAATFTQATAGATGSKTITLGTARYTINFMVALYPAQPAPATPAAGAVVNTTRIVSMIDIKGNIEAESSALEEISFAYSEDTEELGFHSGGAWKWVGNAPGWNDLAIPGAAAILGTTAPTLAAFGPSGGLKVLHFDSAQHDEIHFEIPMPRSWRAGTNIFPFVHWAPVSAVAGNVVWELEYAWQNIDGTFAAPSAMNCQATAAGGVAWVHKMTPFYNFTSGPPYLNYISGAGKTHSSVLVCRVHRNAGAASDTLAAAAAFLAFALRFQVESFGTYTAI